MKKYILLTVAAIAALSSCSSDNDPIVKDPIVKEDKQALVFTATLESNDTRATLDGKTPSWEIGDQISINGRTYTAAASGSSSTFSATITGQEAEGPTFNAYFPATIYNAGTPSLSATQTYEPGKFNMPMYAESTTTELSFKNICAVLAIRITSEDMPLVKKIKVQSDKAMSGIFSIVENRAVLNDASDNSKTVTLDCGLGVSPEPISDGGTTFYLSIPAQEYEYLKIYLSADGSDYNECMATKKATGLGNIARNKIFNINYEKNAVKLWADGPMISTMNLGATTPEGFGDYYGWGETAFYYENGYSQENPLTHFRAGCEGGYVETSYTFSADPYPAVLSPENDAASVNWGANWRMPTVTEWQDMIANCNWSWGQQSSVSGQILTSSNGNRLFLPAAGKREGDTISDVGEYYWFWAADTRKNQPQYIRYWYRNSYVNYNYEYSIRFWGMNIRPVLN